MFHCRASAMALIQLSTPLSQPFIMDEKKLLEKIPLCEEECGKVYLKFWGSCWHLCFLLGQRPNKTRFEERKAKQDMGNRDQLP